jgi:small conductance mechanosensitive channel
LGSEKLVRLMKTHGRVETVAQISSAARQFREGAKAAQREVVVLVPAVAGVLFIDTQRKHLFGVDAPVRIGCSLALIALGWRFAQDVGRALKPWLFRKVEPATAGTISFLIRLSLLGVALLVAFWTAGVDLRALAVGGAFTAVILGIAAQNTLGNLFAGLLLLSARPFRVGDRVRFQAGGVGGRIEGVVNSLGLLYVTLSQGAEKLLVPNNVAISAAVMPLHEPTSVDLRARLKPDVKPSELQSYLERNVTTATRTEPAIHVEEVDDTEVVMRIEATPEADSDGPQLADEILAAVGDVTGRRNGDAAGSGGP